MHNLLIGTYDTEHLFLFLDNLYEIPVPGEERGKVNLNPSRERLTLHIIRYSAN